MPRRRHRQEIRHAEPHAVSRNRGPARRRAGGLRAAAPRRPSRRAPAPAGGGAVRNSQRHRRRAVRDAARPASRRPRPRLHGDGRHASHPPGRGEGRGADVLRGVHEGRRGREAQTNRVPLQRRAGIGDDLAPHGVVRPQAGEDGRRGLPAGAAVRAGRQRALAHRRGRSRLRRRRRHRLQPGDGRRGQQPVPWPGRRHPGLRRVHQRLSRRVQPLAVAEVSHRRELRHDSIGGPVAGAAVAPRHRAQRHRPRCRRC